VERASAEIDAARDRLPDSERIADREHQIADLQTCPNHRIAAQAGARPYGVDAEHGQIGARIGEDHLRFELRAGREAATWMS
jgi:hypothetical protein